MRSLDVKETLNVIIRTWAGSAAVLRAAGIDDLLGFAGTTLQEACRLHNVDCERVAREIVEASGEEARVRGLEDPRQEAAPEGDGVPDVARLFRNRPGTERLTPPPAPASTAFPQGPKPIPTPLPAQAQVAAKPARPPADEELELEEIEPISSEFAPLPARDEAPPPAPPAPPPATQPDDIPDVAAVFRARPRGVPPSGS